MLVLVLVLVLVHVNRNLFMSFVPNFRLMFDCFSMICFRDADNILLLIYSVGL